MASAENGGTPRRQVIIVGLATLVGAALLFLLWFLLIRTPYAPAFTGINSADALTITQELDRLKTPYELADEGTTILVPQDRVDVARVNILGGELPLKGAVGFELFNNSDMGLTDFAQKINYQRALQGELARTIMALDEIESARVHLSLPEAGVFERDRRPAKASITVATKRGGPVDDNVVRGIQQLVASAVPDLNVGNVAVLDSKGALLSATPSEVEPLVTNPAQRQRLMFERGLANQIEEAVRSSGMGMPLAVKVTAIGDLGSADISDASPETADTVAAQDESVTPDKRDFPVSVQIALGVEPGPAVQDKLLDSVRQAMTFDGALGDTVSIAIDPTLAGIASPLPRAAPLQPTPVRKKTEFVSTQFSLWLFGIVGLLVFMLIIWLVVRRTTSKPMSADQRHAFADRLRNLLDQEPPNGQSTT